jgi:hypothetical protein
MIQFVKILVALPSRVLQYTSFSRVKLLTVFMTSLLICIVTSSYAFSQTNQPEKKLALGVRTISVPVAEFCEVFRGALQDIVGENTTVTSEKIMNVYNGDFYSRYMGLLAKKPPRIDIECGPNSVSSGDLFDRKNKKNFSEEILFSEPFYTTDIRLLLTKENAARLSNSNDLVLDLQKLKVGAISETSTLAQINLQKSFFKQIIPLKTIEKSSPRKGTNSLERALSVLDKNGNSSEFDAFASDNIILHSLLEHGVEKSGNEGDLWYVGKRNGYKKNYAIFPSKAFPLPQKNIASWPNFKEEKYAIAIKKGENDEEINMQKWLLEIIKKTLSEQKLIEAKDKLMNYDAVVIFQPPLPPIAQNPQNTIKGSTPPEREPTWWDSWWKSIHDPFKVPVVVIISMIVGGFMNSQIFRTGIKEIIKWAKGLFSNKTSDKTIIGHVFNSKTREGIPNARVSLLASGIPAVKFTDALGIFRFPIKSSINNIEISVKAEGYVIYTQQIDISNSGESIDIGLPPK